MDWKTVEAQKNLLSLSLMDLKVGDLFGIRDCEDEKPVTSVCLVTEIRGERLSAVVINGDYDMSFNRETGLGHMVVDGRTSAISSSILHEMGRPAMDLQGHLNVRTSTIVSVQPLPPALDTGIRDMHQRLKGLGGAAYKFITEEDGRILTETLDLMAASMTNRPAPVAAKPVRKAAPAP